MNAIKSHKNHKLLPILAPIRPRSKAAASLAAAKQSSDGVAAAADARCCALLLPAAVAAAAAAAAVLPLLLPIADHKSHKTIKAIKSQIFL